MRPSFRFALRVPTLALPVLLACSAVAAPAAPRTLAPDAAVMGPPFEIRGSAVSLESHGVLVRVEPLDEGRRGAFFALRSVVGKDPMPGPEIVPDGYTVFEVSLVNESGQSVSFAPGFAQCWLDRDRELRRLESDQALALLRVASAAAPDPDQAAVIALDAFHVSPVTLENGERVSRLLVFKGQPSRTERVRLNLEVLVGTEDLRPHFHFTASDRRAAGRR